MQKYPGQEKEILDYYQKNQDAIRQLTAPVFEDKVIDFILERVNLRDVKVSREDLFDSGIKENKKPKKKAKTKSTPASNSKPVSKSKKATIKKTK